MSTSGSLILFVSLGILLVVGMSALGDFRANVNNTSASVQNSADLGTDVINPLFTVLGYIGLAVAAIALLQAFRNM